MNRCLKFRPIKSIPRFLRPRPALWRSVGAGRPDGQRERRRRAHRRWQRRRLLRLNRCCRASAAARSSGSASPRPAAQAAPPAAAPAMQSSRNLSRPAQDPILSAPAPAPKRSSAGAEEAKEPQGPLSPLVRKMARENNIDLSQVRGTGAGGRITKDDVESYIRQRTQPAAPQAPAAPRPAAPAPSPRVEPAVPIGQAQPTAKTRIEPMSNMRQKIAEHMVLSKRTSAHVTTVHRVDMTRVAKMRAKHKEDFAARYGMSLTFLPFVARARGGSPAALPRSSTPRSTARTSSTTTRSISESPWRSRTA